MEARTPCQCLAVGGLSMHAPWQVAPRELLVPRGMLSPASQRLLKTPATPINIVAVTPGTEFPEPSALASPDSYEVSYIPIMACTRVL